MHRFTLKGYFADTHRKRKLSNYVFLIFLQHAEQAGSSVKYCDKKNVRPPELVPLGEYEQGDLSSQSSFSDW